MLVYQRVHQKKTCWFQLFAWLIGIRSKLTKLTKLTVAGNHHVNATRSTGCACPDPTKLGSHVTFLLPRAAGDDIPLSIFRGAVNRSIAICPESIGDIDRWGFP
jgi:hypothetical protein